MAIMCSKAKHNKIFLMISEDQGTNNCITHSLDTSQRPCLLKPLDGSCAPVYLNYEFFQYDWKDIQFRKWKGKSKKKSNKFKYLPLTMSPLTVCSINWKRLIWKTTISKITFYQKSELKWNYLTNHIPTYNL